MPAFAMSVAALCLAALLGALTWSFAEYAIHHWVGHLTRGRTEFSREHLTHHRVHGYFTPTPKKVRAAAPIIGLLAVVTGVLLGAPGLAFTVGFAFAYVAYELAHHAIHARGPTHAYGRWARRHHLYHHHVDPRKNHGVTSPLWDIVFRTWAHAPRVTMPAQRAPVWLLDAQGVVKPDLANAFGVRASAARAQPG